MRGPLAHLFARAPRPLRRRAYLRHLGYEPEGLARMFFKLAETLEERTQCFRLLHDMYVRRGLIDPTPTGTRFTVYSVLPTTAIFAGVREGRVVSTMSLIEDSPLGVPMEKLYRQEIGRLRLERRRFAEVSALAVETESRHKGLALMMYNLMFRWAYFYRSVDDLVIAVHPKAADFYRSVLLFETLGGLRAYESLKDAPAVALRLDLQTAVRRYRALYGKDRETPRNPIGSLYRFFCETDHENLLVPALGVDTSRRIPPPEWSHEDVSRLFEEHGFDIASLTAAERRFFVLEYPNLDWSIPRAHAFRRSRSGLRAGGRTGSPVAEALLAAATRAPSSDNTQPWRFTVDSKSGRIAFFLDEARDPSPLNAGQSRSRLALGCAIENLVRTAQANGWKIEEEAPPPPALAMFRVLDEGRSPAPSHVPVVDRVTNRHRYDGRRLAEAAVSRLSAKTPDLDGVRTIWVLDRERIDDLAALVSRAETIVVGQRALRRARFSHIRFDRRRDEEVTEGIPVSSLELGGTREAFLRRIARLPDWLVTAFGYARFWGAEAGRLVRSASGVCLVVAKDPGPAADLAAGRAVQRAWLALTAEGFAAQPLQSLAELTAVLGRGAPALVEKLPRRRLEALRRDLNARVPETREAGLAFVMRFGQALPPSARSGRQPIESVTRQAPLAPPARPASSESRSPRRSRRTRVLFVGEAISLLHVRRPHALAESMNPDLYEPVLACDARFHRLFSPARFQVIPVRSISAEQFLDALESGSPVYDANTLEEYVEEDLRLLREVGPDVIVGDFRLSLGVSARLTGIPYVALSEACWSPYGKVRFPIGENRLTRALGPRAAEALFRAARKVVFAYHALPMNVVRRRHGLPMLRPDLRRVFTDADYVLYVDVPELAPLYELPANHQYLGPVLASPAPPLPDWWDSRPRDVPTVFVALGGMTPPRVLPLLLEALEGAPVTVVAESRGRSLPRKPRNACVADFLPRARVVREAQLMVCDGSASSAHQAFAEGVPVLGIVSNMNQQLNMHNVSVAGAGRFARADEVQKDALRSLVLEMLERPSFSETARTLARTLARYDAAARFQDLVAKIPVHAASGP